VTSERIKFIVGITGGSGVGKTTLIKKLYHDFAGRVSTFSLDNYYLPKEHQWVDENGVINFDLPTALGSESHSNGFDTPCGRSSPLNKKFTRLIILTQGNTNW
jgi:GTPase SAR1 family protein